VVYRVKSDNDVVASACETAEKLVAKPAPALEARNRRIKQPFREQIKVAMKAESEEFSASPL
jgi:enoyl-CoA hydratase/carnithine racemase